MKWKRANTSTRETYDERYSNTRIRIVQRQIALSLGEEQHNERKIEKLPQQQCIQACLSTKNCRCFGMLFSLSLSVHTLLHNEELALSLHNNNNSQFATILFRSSLNFFLFFFSLTVCVQLCLFVRHLFHQCIRW